MAAKLTKKKSEEVVSPQQEPEIDMRKAGRLLQEIAVIVNNTVKHYWLSQADANNDITECYKSLSDLLKSCPQITVRIVGGSPTINGNHLEMKDSLLDPFFAQMTSLGIDNFYIVSGVTNAEFIKFCDIICARPDELKQLGGFAAVLDKFELKNIRTKKLIVREIADAEVVLSKDEFDRISGAAGQGKDVGQGGVGDILAFLKGDVMVKDESLATKIKEVASDPERMAELILQAADIRQRADIESGESLGEFIVGCLRRTYETMAKEPSLKTPSGKKKTARSFVLLEEAIVKRMREMDKETYADDDLEAIVSATEEITDEIKIDAMAEEYVNRVAAFRESENKFAKFIKQEGITAVGESVLQKKFAERGISMPGWQGLVMKGDTGGGGSASGFSNAHILDAISHLDMLLDNMEKEFSKMSKAQQDENARKMWNILEDVDVEIQKLTAHTDIKIGNLLEAIQTDVDVVGTAEAEAQVAGKGIVLTRKQVLGVIADVVREITEPLELIRTSLEMMTSKAFGSNAEMQANVLQLATDNADLMKNLLDRLRSISSVISAKVEDSSGNESGKKVD